MTEAVSPVEKAPKSKTVIPAWKRRHPEAIGIRIILEENEDIPPTGLFIGISGENFSLMPGVEVEVPDYILDHLDRAVKGVPVIDSKTKRVIGYKEVRRFPYQVLRGRTKSAAS